MILEKIGLLQPKDQASKEWLAQREVKSQEDKNRELP